MICFQTELVEELIIRLYHIDGRNNMIRVLNVVINTSKQRKRLRVLSLLLSNKKDFMMVKVLELMLEYQEVQNIHDNLFIVHDIS